MHSKEQTQVYDGDDAVIKSKLHKYPLKIISDFDTQFLTRGRIANNQEELFALVEQAFAASDLSYCIDIFESRPVVTIESVE